MEFEWINRRYGELTSEILASGYAGTYSKLEEGMATTVLVKWEYKKYELPILLVVIFTEEEGTLEGRKENAFLQAGKHYYGAEIDIHYKGSLLKRLSKGRMFTKPIYFTVD